MRILVVGAGIFGVTAAEALAREGHDVLVLERGHPPHPEAASTDISKAVRPDYGADAFYTDLLLRGWPTWEALAAEGLFHQTGALFLTREPMAAGGFEFESRRVLAGRGLATEAAGPSEVAARWPAWRPEAHADGYFNPRAGYAESARVVAWWLARAEAAGARLRPEAPVSALEMRGGRVVGVRLESGEALLADRVVFAQGAFTPVALPWLADRIRAVGQPVLHFRPARPALFEAARFPVWSADVSRTGWYGFPLSSDGVVKVAHHGAGVLVDPRGPRVVAPEIHERFRAFLRDALPELADAPVVAERLCLYCDTFDGDFWIDEDPDRPGLVVAAGGSGHAFKFAPVLGAIVADVVQGRASPWRARFAWRARGADAAEEARFVEGG